MGKILARISLSACLAATLALPVAARQQSDSAEPVVIVPYSAASDIASEPEEGRLIAPVAEAPIDFDSGSKESVETRVLDADFPRWSGGVQTDRVSVEPFKLTPPPRNPGLAGR